MRDSFVIRLRPKYSFESSLSKGEKQRDQGGRILSRNELKLPVAGRYDEKTYLLPPFSFSVSLRKKKKKKEKERTVYRYIQNRVSIASWRLLANYEPYQPR